MLPVLGREVVERQQFVTIFTEALGHLWVIGTVGLHEEVKSLMGLLTYIGHPDVVQPLFGPRLQSLRQFVNDVAVIVKPTALFFGPGENFW